MAGSNANIANHPHQLSLRVYGSRAEPDPGVPDRFLFQAEASAPAAASPVLLLTDADARAASGSAHAGGLQAVLCDGSVRALPERDPGAVPELGLGVVAPYDSGVF